jgi:O-antigen ligase
VNRRASGRGYPWLVALVALVTGSAWIFGGHMGVALVPVIVVAAVWAVWRMPVRWPVATLLFVALLVENPQARPMEGRWQSPLYPVGELLYTNLSVLVGVEALRISALEVLFLGLAGVLAVRRLCGMGTDGVAPMGHGARWLTRLLLVAFAAVIFLEVWGMARGGDFRQSLWQMRQLFWLPVICWLCLHAFRRPGDLYLVTGVIIVVGILRAGFGFAYYVMSRLEGHVPAYVTTHSDSVLWGMIVVICLAALLERPSSKIWLLCATVLPVIGLALLVNDRRLAFVSIGAVAFVLAFIVRTPVRRKVRRLVLVASPVLLLYVAVGWHVQHRIFAPINTFRTVAAEADSSTMTRDVENFNLVFTALESPLIGSGFGHPYNEHVATHRIDHIFAQYLYMPHNTVLWLLAVGGVVGFLALWGFLPLVIWLSVRSYRRARNTTERVVALGGVAAVVIYAIQAWGDMGVYDWMAVFLLAAYVGLAGNLERHVGAWRLDAETAQPGGAAVPPAPEAPALARI